MVEGLSTSVLSGCVCADLMKFQAAFKISPPCRAAAFGSVILSYNHFATFSTPCTISPPCRAASCGFVKLDTADPNHDTAEVPN